MHINPGVLPIEASIILIISGGIVLFLTYRYYHHPELMTSDSFWYRWIYYRYYYDEDDEFIQMTEGEIKRYMKRAFFVGLLVFLNGLVILLLLLLQ